MMFMMPIPHDADSAHQQAHGRDATQQERESLGCLFERAEKLGSVANVEVVVRPGPDRVLASEYLFDLHHRDRHRIGMPDLYRY
jgi:hypothetical protein